MQSRNQTPIPTTQPRNSNPETSHQSSPADQPEFHPIPTFPDSDQNPTPQKGKGHQPKVEHHRTGPAGKRGLLSGLLQVSPSLCHHYYAYPQDGFLPRGF
nr:hypothetical protein Itr_chr05CG21020 [Ipomoea trifida]